ncbi:uncharacterized protein LOC135202433 [Macrobrachium nipponense]|uniref:uncharacterized protein LOC135202433 n=1 Tax=Macrobrachium nipponense TaxID=159736 RepID=UPI0030C83A44
MVNTTDEGAEGMKRTPLMRRHTIEVQPPHDHKLEDLGLCVSRAFSDDAWAGGNDSDSAADGGQRPSTTSFSGKISSPEGGTKEGIKEFGPRIAWCNEPDGDLQVEGLQASIKPPKQKSLRRPKSCVTPVPSAAVVSDVPTVITDLPEKSEAWTKSPEKEISRTSSPSGKELPSGELPAAEEPLAEQPLPEPATEAPKKSAPFSSNEILDRIAAKVCRSQSSPDIYGQNQKRKIKSASLDEEKSDVITSFEPYDGLLIHRATFFSPLPRRDTSSSLGHEDEDEVKETDKTSKLLGYRPKNGYYFMPFSKLFTKPKSARSRHSSKSSSQGDPELGVANSLQQFNEAEKDIIKKTRSALKQRISSANKKRLNSANKKKIQLNIVVNAKTETDESLPCSDNDETTSVQRPSSTSIADLGKKKKAKKAKHRERSVPAELLRSKLGATREKKTFKVKAEKKKQSKTVKRPKNKKEIPTMMSEISPVGSDVENDNDFERYENLHEFSGALRNSKNRPYYSCDYYGEEDRGFAPARGGFLQTIISEANVYKPVSRTWKGNKMHLEVRIRTHQSDSSSGEEGNEEGEEEGDGEEQGRMEEEKRRWARRGRLSKQNKIESPSSAGSPAEGKTMGGLLLPGPRRRQTANRLSSSTLSPAALRAKEREKLRQILEVCTAKVEESKTLMRKLGSNGVWVSLDTLQRGLMTPTEYRVYQDYLKSLEPARAQRKEGTSPPPSAPTQHRTRSILSPFRR